MTQVTNVGEDEKWQAIRGAKRFSSGQQWFEVVISRQANTANTVRFPFSALKTANANAVVSRSHATLLLPLASSKVLPSRYGLSHAPTASLTCLTKTPCSPY